MAKQIIKSEHERITELEEQMKSLIGNVEKLQALGQSLSEGTMATESNDDEHVTDTTTLTTDDVILAGAQRTRQVLEILQGGFKIVEKEKSLRLRLEVFDSRRTELTKLEYRAFFDAVNRINIAIERGHIELTPGVDSMRLLNVAEAMEALVPGIYVGNHGTPSFYAIVSGQLFPPGITIDLTPGETTTLIAALATGSGAAWVASVLGGGWAASLIAAILALDAGVIALLQSISTTGAVGFKITGLPPLIPIVVPYPI